jgi:hypothetical protein
MIFDVQEDARMAERSSAAIAGNDVIIHINCFERRR